MNYCALSFLFLSLSPLIAAECQPPAATNWILIPSRAGTTSGPCSSTSKPRPSCPRLKIEDQEINVIYNKFLKQLGRNETLEHIIKEQRKIYLPLPRLCTTPNDVNSKACSLPQATDVTCLAISIGLNTRTGFVSLPSWSCPLAMKPTCPVSLQMTKNNITHF